MMIVSYGRQNYTIIDFLHFRYSAYLQIIMIYGMLEIVHESMETYNNIFTIQIYNLLLHETYLDLILRC